MNKVDGLKKLVTEKYAEVAKHGTSCCSSDGGCIDDINFIGEDYQKLDGYFPDADLGLGCGLPTEYAQIKEGDVVVDLGSGAGNDCFVARTITGPHGKIIGVDFTPAMIEKANKNTANLGYKNVHFVEGDIENIPLSDNTADVVVSNCVMNLVPDKNAAFNETYRILKPGGHFSISDVVVEGELPGAIRKSAEMYAGCVSGAEVKETYLEIINKSGFKNISIQKESKINLPQEILETVLRPDEIQSFLNGKSGIYSITVYGEKPSDCCESSCCN